MIVELFPARPPQFRKNPHGMRGANCWAKDQFDCSRANTISFVFTRCDGTASDETPEYDVHLRELREEPRET